jgi:hypothetical protein
MKDEPFDWESAAIAILAGVASLLWFFKPVLIPLFRP